MLFLAVTIGYVGYLDHTVRTLFEGKRWALPARVYARPLELYPGMKLSAEQFATELGLLKYHTATALISTGIYRRQGSEFDVVTRPFTFWDGKEPSVHVRAVLEGDRVGSIVNVSTGEPVGLVRFDPALIGGIYPAQKEDRVLVRLQEVPRLLIDALLTVEDRRFYEHHGISPRAIARALFANLRAGSMVQGGSTLSQQLVKNFFLSNERTLTRKVNEAIMALLLEWHYEKDEILEAYLNEVYLGQDGARSIHGFGLASQFYFDRPLSELAPEQIALLVAEVKGPSYYDPRRNPQRARQRRNLVLDLLGEGGFLAPAQVQRAKSSPLGVTRLAPGGASPYPAFLDLVRRQLRRDYQEQDLNSEGLQIFTTLDPLVQKSAERALASRVRALERSRDLKEGELQGAVVVTSVEGGEVLALVGGRDARFSGFNRALDAERLIGSLIKPAVYLTALERPHEYTLVSVLDDAAPLRVKNYDGSFWTPKNYDQELHGLVPLHTALAQSYNLPTARLGLALGVPQVVAVVHRLGVERELKPFPSLLLGAVAMTPLEVAQMYQTLAGGGFRTPLRAIREVLTVAGEPLQRYPLRVEQAFDPAPVYLLNTALQEVARTGTARSLYRSVPAELNVAGKTGTTDDLRDSWYAGFTGDLLGVVWLGTDDNQPTGLTGASGALQVWAQLMVGADPRPLRLTRPANVTYAWVDQTTGSRTDRDCAGSASYPFAAGSEPVGFVSCTRTADALADQTVRKTIHWIKGIFQ